MNGKYEINLELGGGINPTKNRAEGQDNYINFDMLNAPTVDVVTNFFQTLPIPDDTVKRIFSREMIEHLPYKRLPEFIGECYRVMQPGGEMYLCCPDFESILKLYSQQCACFNGHTADPQCPDCNGTASFSHYYWRSNLLGDQNDYGDDGFNDTHKNQITYGMLSGLLKQTGFVDIRRDSDNPYYEVEKRRIKLSVICRKPI